jgi:hypothetical protein
MIVFFSSDSHGNLFYAALEKVVREQRVLYGKHMDITSYDGKRETHNPVGGCNFKKTKAFLMNCYVLNSVSKIR